MEYLKGKFIGSDQIQNIVLSKEKTYLNNEKVDIEYENGEKACLPKKNIEKIITKEQSDHTKLRIARTSRIAEEILILLAESELLKADLDYLIMTLLPESLSQHKRLADKILWGKEDDDITLLDIEKVLRNGDKKTTPKRRVVNKPNKK